MYEEDYVKRLIQLLAAAVVRMVELVKDKDFKAARVEMQYVLDELFGVSESMVLALSEEDVLDLVFRGGPVDPERLGALAEVLRINGDIAAGEGLPDQAHLWHETALRYLTLATSKYAFQPDTETLESFEATLQTLSPDSLPPDLLASMYTLYRGAGKHALASKLILAFAEKTGREPEGVEEARSYLKELSRMGEGALRRGKITREQILSMLASLPPSVR